MRLLLCQEIPLERRHLILTKQRRAFAEPDIPHHISASLPLHRIQGMESLPNIALQNLIQTLAFIRLPIDLHDLKASVLIQRYAAVIQ